ncbi:MAG: hypothetical protein ABIV48_11860 [Pyrinomonadaceae bacterium]
MELLIPGLILVALMVYASTRIKKTAALAFESESIDTEKFLIEKPEGFLSVINGDPALAFEAYSKEFGGDGAEDIKQARVEIRFLQNTDIRTAASAIKSSSAVVTDISEKIGDKLYRLVEAERSEKGIGLLEFYKIAQSSTGVLELKVITLEETDPAIAKKVAEIIKSFTVK